MRTNKITQIRQTFGGRIPELDGIRGIAILAVLFYHFFSYSMFHREWTGVGRLFMRVTENWSQGVDLFFVLSGLLITGILLDSKSDPRFFRNFYARRALRILPLYYAVLLVILICYPGSGSYTLLSFFHLSNTAPILGIAMVNGAMWSLSVEEHFYLCWPAVVHRFELRTIAWIAGAVCVAEPVIRGLAFSHVVSVFPYSWFRFDGIATGALISCFVRSRYYSAATAKRAIAGLAAAGILLELTGTPWRIRELHTLLGATLKFPAIDMMCAALVLWGASMSGRRQTAVLRSAPLRICGDLSYCLYLSHCMLMDAYDIALKRLGQPAAITSFRSILLRAAVVLIASFAVAVVSRHFLELPALRLKRLFEPASRDSITASHERAYAKTQTA